MNIINCKYDFTMNKIILFTGYGESIDYSKLTNLMYARLEFDIRQIEVVLFINNNYKSINNCYVDYDLILY